WLSPTTDGQGQLERRECPLWHSPTATTPACSSERPRARSKWWCRLMTTCYRVTTTRSRSGWSHESQQPYESKSVILIPPFRACILRVLLSLRHLSMTPERLLCVTSWTVPTARSVT